MKKDVDDYLQEGIYGPKEINPSERRKYLGTLRERIVLVLTNGQLVQGEGLAELEKAMKEYPDATLLLDRQVSNRFRKPYRQLANKHRIQHTTVDNQEVETDVGAVLAVDYAVEKEDITVTEKAEKKEEKKGFWKSLFGRS
ncbi:YueI family protein [Halobacillus litoralis]|uniref:YueI family protein n=1 Tax=Halobacillus litoralis TaxID=45668 RepID=UPI001CD3728A|nr:YueI family protein [Halobacillus litoralis]MCA0970575.1 YueI family protein [Halobacillus litoralis]